MTKKIRTIVNNIVETDVIVIGGGLAGLMAAIRAKELTDKVIVVDKGIVSRSGVSVFAAGIYSVRFPDDNRDVWLKEMIELGDYLNDQEWVSILIDEMYPIAMKIDGFGEECKLGVFEKDEKGFIKRKSRGHINTHHILVNSIPMMDTLKRASIKKGIKFFERVMVTDIILTSGRLGGVIGFNTFTGETYLFTAKAAILSSGGCGLKSVYIAHRNLTGDAQAIAFRKGAILRNMEQTSSNTVARNFDIHGLNLYVGSGGKFLNRFGDEFMWKYNPRLGNRARLTDLVISFCKEVKEDRGPVYLDMTSVSREDQELMRKILPESFKVWDRCGINPFKEKIEWIPAFRLKMGAGGGLNINTNCETNIPGVYAAGDTTCAPAHGTYSFGGVNLAFAAVSGDRAGLNASIFSNKNNCLKVSPESVASSINDTFKPLTIATGSNPDEIISEMQRIIFPYYVSFLRRRETLEGALTNIEKIMNEKIPYLKVKDIQELIKACEVKNMLVLVQAFLTSALTREESRGFHYREDFPYTNNKKWLKWTTTRYEDREIKTFIEDVPLKYISPET